MKKIVQYSNSSTGKIARVYRDSVFDEFVVRFYRSTGEHLTGSDYHTDDKVDALDTALHCIAPRQSMSVD